MAEFSREVADCYPSDSQQGIARLDPSAIEGLGLNPGGTVRIEGAVSTTATVWRLDREDWADDIIRIDTQTRKEVRATTGDTVGVTNAEVQDDG